MPSHENAVLTIDERLDTISINAGESGNQSNQLDYLRRIFVVGAANVNGTILYNRESFRKSYTSLRLVGVIF